MGRPRSSGIKINETLGVRLTPLERSRVREVALKFQLTDSELARQALRTGLNAIIKRDGLFLELPRDEQPK